MMPVWETKRIKYCAKLSPPCDTSKLLPDSDVTFTPMECIKNGFFLNRKVPFSTVNGSYTQYQEGDIVIAKVTPCFENGNIAEMFGLYSGFGFGSSELFVLRPYSIQSRFLFYVLQSEDFKEKGCATMTGTGGLKRVSPAFIANYRIAVPQPDKQERISTFLDKKCAEIDAVMEKTRASIEEYKKLKQAIITQAVTKGVRRDRPMKESGIEWIGNIPSDYSVYRLKHLVNGHLEYGANASGIEFSSNLPRYIRITDITPDGKLKEFGKLSLEEDAASPYILRDGDILFARSGATVGKSFIYKETYGRAAFAGYLIKATMKTGFSADYVYLYTNSSLYDSWKNRIFIQSTIQNIGADRYAELPIVIPDSFDEQLEIVHYLNNITMKINMVILKKKQILAEIESYKKSLIYEYVTGKKEVSA